MASPNLALQPKPTTGDRALACTPELVRLQGAIRAPTPDKWCESQAAWWDHAVKGSSALRAALVRALFDEIDMQMGRDIIAGMVDLQAFYDTIKCSKLLKAGKRSHEALARLGELVNE